MTENRIFASPLARRLAEQNTLDVSAITGTGPHGRVIKRDIQDFLENGGATALFGTGKVAPSRPTPFEPAYKEIPLSQMRKVIATRLLESKQQIPHFYVSADVEIDALLSARAYLNDMADGAYKISVNDIVLKAVAVALKKIPEANRSWTDEGFVKQYSAVDISVAVAIPEGLITPIIRNADYKTIVEISQEMKDLASKARAGELKPEQFQGGTISVSNLGMYGVKNFSPIVNPPQACILGVGAGMQQPFVKEGLLSVATVMNLTLSVDHRVVDGSVGAELLSVIKETLEQPISLMM